jgi:hypothetical protein
MQQISHSPRLLHHVGPTRDEVAFELMEHLSIMQSFVYLALNKEDIFIQILNSPITGITLSCRLWRFKNKTAAIAGLQTHRSVLGWVGFCSQITPLAVLRIILWSSGYIKPVVWFHTEFSFRRRINLRTVRQIKLNISEYSRVLKFTYSIRRMHILFRCWQSKVSKPGCIHQIPPTGIIVVALFH